MQLQELKVAQATAAAVRRTEVNVEIVMQITNNCVMNFVKK